ncbi:uncharacterized protein FOMMEDRAFT_160832 [Fomitiporia mediterranea MF3/22]|uniref:uncharacterized protein n=1 Tax=Fomitiporia mediterranea (strain MF3/22) TaxID=694068 RepID=UPI000440885A|nr:uncharacterized protein FOMMEDRAFT_160832 [Fomitiporia mediterranea MF3/22]EJC99239.1 hypothetical protein FOMMEDRAFT_160832 [Fomitiporia mediterranea MF3/22]
MSQETQTGSSQPGGNVAEHPQHLSHSPTPATFASQLLDPNYMHSGYGYGHTPQRHSTPGHAFAHNSQPGYQYAPYTAQFYQQSPSAMLGHSPANQGTPFQAPQTPSTPNFLVDNQGHQISPRRAGGHITDRVEDLDSSGDQAEAILAPGKSKAKEAKKDKTVKKPAGKQKKGQGSKSGVNAREGGKSDEETDSLDLKLKAAANIKTSASSMSERACWTDDDKTALLSYVLDASQWPDFKFAACRARQEHTGGGDGDVFRINHLNLEDAALNDETDTKKKRKRSGRSATAASFSEAQLDAFEASIHFQMLDEV